MAFRSALKKLARPLKDGVKDKLSPKLLQESEEAPEWQLQSWDDSWHRHRTGKKNSHWAVMVFYPADDTPGCTAQLQDFQAHYAQFKALGAEIYAINPAEAPSHKAFAEKLGLEFPVLTDRGGVVARQFHAAIQTPVKTVVLRTVYLVNPKRKIRLANRGAPPAEAILRSIQALQQATKDGM